MKTIDRVVVAALVSALAIGGFSTAGLSAPFAQAAPKQLADRSDVVQVQQRVSRPRGVRPRVVQRQRRGNDAAIAAAIGIGVLGIAAAAAAAQPRERYYVDNRRVPVDAWGNPVYGQQYYYQQPGYQQQYYQQQYYQQPGGYYYEQPRQLSRWEKDQIKAQNRALIEQQKAQRRAERDQRRWAEQQQWQQQWQGDVPYGYPVQRVRPQQQLRWFN